MFNIYQIVRKTITDSKAFSNLEKLKNLVEKHKKVLSKSEAFDEMIELLEDVSESLDSVESELVDRMCEFACELEGVETLRDGYETFADTYGYLPDVLLDRYTKAQQLLHFTFQVKCRPFPQYKESEGFTPVVVVPNPKKR